MGVAWWRRARVDSQRQARGPTSARGHRAEQIAEQFLVGKGARIIERNYRCRFGEVDLIAQHGRTLLFVEVRLRMERNGSDFGGAAASITPAKQQRVIAAARHYLAGRHDLPPCRFDAILLTELSARGLEWLQGAFGE
jgi:putative endonuclease